MRGKVLPVGRRCAGLRITPAYAGKRWMWWRTTAPPLDHPRVCGEKHPEGCGFWAWLGSPPRMRGKEVSGLLDLFVKGITPAYAGKRTPSTTMRTTCRDHPRVCGEKEMEIHHLAGTAGSPPRMRGKALGQDVRHELFGITPAYAGKSRRSAHRKLEPMGSPPRMRGKAMT